MQTCCLHSAGADGAYYTGVIRLNGEKQGLPDVESPAVEGILGQPDSAWEMVNKYGTYEIQPTADTDNEYPMILQGLPKQWEKSLQKKRRRWKQTPPESPHGGTAGGCRAAAEENRTPRPNK